jgi:hypothetical protein
MMPVAMSVRQTPTLIGHQVMLTSGLAPLSVSRRRCVPAQPALLYVYCATVNVGEAPGPGRRNTCR